VANSPPKVIAAQAAAASFSLVTNMPASTPLTICEADADDAPLTSCERPAKLDAAALNGAGAAAAALSRARHAATAADVVTIPRDAKNSRMRSTARLTRLRAAGSLRPSAAPISR
jgi:hypothetical protein